MSFCGDGFSNPTEECDDGNNDTETRAYGDTECVVCAADCTLQAGDVNFCGDGTVNNGEACDDGNTQNETCPYGAVSCVVCAADCTMQPRGIKLLR